MNFLKALFGGKEDDPEEKKKDEESKNFDVLKYDGIVATKTGQDEYAIKCFRHALEIKDDLEIRDFLSQALIHRNELLPAYEELQKLAEAQPENQQIFMRIANVTYMMEDYNLMADACEKALLIDPENAEVYYMYARACIGQKDLVNAVAMLTKAISKKEDYGEAYLLRGDTLLKMGDINSADEDVAFLLEHVDNNEDVLMLKARIENAKGNADESLSYYDKVIDANPFSVDAYKERGAIRLQKGDKEGSAEDMQKVLELNPEGAADINGEYSAEGVEAQVRKAYRDNNPFGLG
jgi:tetratricopeptide (TPR) repeat protein